MPFVKIEIKKGHTKEYKKMMLQSVHEALVNSLSIPDDDRIQRLYEIDNDYFELNDYKTDKFTLIELTFFPGRSKEMKKNAIKEITRLLEERLEIMPSDVYIIINEHPLDNWGMRGNQASDMELKYAKE